MKSARIVAAFVAIQALTLGSRSLGEEPLPEHAVARLGSAGIKVGLPYHLTDATISRDGKHLAVVETPQKATVYDLATEKVVCRLSYTNFFNQDLGELVLAFAADGKTIAFGPITCFDMFEIPSGKRLKRLGTESLHNGDHRVRSENFTADGSRMALLVRAAKLGEAGTVELFDCATAKSVASFPSIHQGGHAFLSPDGKRVASSGYVPHNPGGEHRPENQMLQIWDLTTKKEMKRLAWTLPTPNHHVTTGFGLLTDGSFSPDGKKFAVLTYEAGTIIVFDVDAGKEIRRITPDADGLNHLAFSPDGETLVGWAAEPFAWRVADGSSVPLTGPKVTMVRAVAFPKKDEVLALGSIDQSLTWWDAVSGKIGHKVVGHVNSVTSLAFTKDGKLLRSASFDRQLTTWDQAAKAVVAEDIVGSFQGRRKPFDTFQEVDLSSDATRFFGCHFRGEMTGWKLEKTKSDVYFQTRGDPKGLNCFGIGFDPKMLVVSDGVSFRVCNTDAADGFNGEKLPAQPFDDPQRLAVRVRLSPDSKMVVAVLAVRRTAPPKTDPVLRLYDADSGKVVRELPTPHPEALVPFSPDGKWILHEGIGTVSLVRVGDGKLEAKLPMANAKGFVSAATFEPSSRRVAYATFARGDKSAVIEIVEIPSGRSLLRFEGHAGAVRSLAFSPDGTTLASGSDDATVLLWNAKTP